MMMKRIHEINRVLEENKNEWEEHTENYKHFVERTDNKLSDMLQESMFNEKLDDLKEMM